MLSRQGPSKVRTAALERECLRLRMEGLSHRAIARELHVAPSTAYKRVQHGLQELNRSNDVKAAELRTLEALRLDEMQEAVWEKAVEGDLRAIDRVLKIMTRRGKLLGLDVSEKKTKDQDPELDPTALRFRDQLILTQIRAELLGLSTGPDMEAAPDAPEV
jgi:DNA-binding CsgD family transcriptional regulator